MVKRLFDLIVSLLGIVALLPVFIVLCLLIRCDGGPAFFKQKRVGKSGRFFKLYKFRSMLVNAEHLGAKITASHDPRITLVGSLLRRTKLDELPQLFNVFAGDMSIVGPRPEVPYYVTKWSDRDREIVLSVKPGITDYATLFYHDEQAVLAGAGGVEEAYVEVVMPHKLAMYQRYVWEQGFLLDLRIIMATLAKIFRVDFLIRFLRIA